MWQTPLPRLRLDPRPRLRHGFASKAAFWHRVAMLLRFVEARLKTLEHVRQRDGVKDDSTAGLLQRKLATYKLGVDDAAAVTAVIIDSNALTPACIDACVSIINESCDLTPPREESGGKRQKLGRRGSADAMPVVSESSHADGESGASAAAAVGPGIHETAPGAPSASLADISVAVGRDPAARELRAGSRWESRTARWVDVGICHSHGGCKSYKRPS